MNKLNIDTEIVNSSELKVDGVKSERLFNYVKKRLLRYFETFVNIILIWIY